MTINKAVNDLLSLILAPIIVVGVLSVYVMKDW